MGPILSWDVLSIGTYCPWDPFCLGTFCFCTLNVHFVFKAYSPPPPPRQTAPLNHTPAKNFLCLIPIRLIFNPPTCRPMKRPISRQATNRRAGSCCAHSGTYCRDITGGEMDSNGFYKVIISNILYLFIFSPGELSFIYME